MYDDRTFDLGQFVQDEISGFVGVVFTVGFHINGCERIGVRRLGDSDDPPKTVSKEEFFYPTQLDLVEKQTQWSDIDPVTEIDCEIGERVRERSTMFEGHVHVVNFSLFNCPQALAYKNSGEVEARWIDAPLIEPLGDAIEVPSVTGEQATGAATVDTSPDNLSSERA